MKPFRTIEDIRRHHRGHWFDRDTMRFFGTRFCDSGRVHAGRFFVTSEQPPHGDRIYAVRCYDAETDSVETIEPPDDHPEKRLFGYVRRTTAIAAAKAAAKEEKKE